MRCWSRNSCLQQTTVSAVIPYFERWMARFPTLASLARCAEEDVLALWQGLGYYGRAHNLRQVAVTLVEQGRPEGSRFARRASQFAGGGCLHGSGNCFLCLRCAGTGDRREYRPSARATRNWKEPVDDAAGRAFLRQRRGTFCQTEWPPAQFALMELRSLGLRGAKSEVSHCRSAPIARPRTRNGCRLRKAPRPIERVNEARAFIFERGKLWLERAPGPRWRELWMLPQTKLTNRCADHVELYSITRFRVTMGIYVESRQDRALGGYASRRLCRRCPRRTDARGCSDAAKSS